MRFSDYHTAYVVPTPKEISLSGKEIRLDSAWGVVDRASAPGPAARFAQELGLPLGERARNLALGRQDGLRQEEYRLDISEKGVTATASSDQGLLHALATLRQLRNGPILPAGRISDYPRLAIRGFHLMFESIHQLRAADAMALISSAARLKLNTLLLEFGPRFPFERHAAVRSPSALTATELKELIGHAQSLGMECIPLLQSLGHLGYLLRHEEYADIREEEQHRDQMCPSNGRSLQVFTELAEEILAFFPEARFMHVGADETRRLGVCPRCRETAEKRGRGSLYIDHANKVCSWVIERGLTPILWDDILCAHPHLVRELHEGAWVMYWDYWTTQSPSPLIVARHDAEGNRGVVVYDARWQSEWRADLSEVTASTLAAFAQPVDMRTRLGGEFAAVFGPYLGDELPRYVRAFPYLEFLQDSGHRVIGAPAGLSNTSEWLNLPDYPRYVHNIKAFADRCAEAGAEGLVTTAWYNCPPEALYPSLLATAQSTW